MKQLLLVIVFLISGLDVFCQDIIYIKDSEPVEVEYQDIDWDHIFVIKKNDIKRSVKKIPMEIVDSLKGNDLKFLQKIEKKQWKQAYKIKYSQSQKALIALRAPKPNLSESEIPDNTKSTYKPDSISTVSDYMVRMSFINYNGVSYECMLGKRSTFTIEGGIVVQPKIYFSVPEPGEGSSGIKGQFNFSINPYLEVGQRNYYNLLKRAMNHKNVANNSANYVGPKVLIFANPLYSTSIKYSEQANVSLGVVWGLQRVYKDGAFINLEFGLAYTRPFDQITVADELMNSIRPISSVKFGVLLSKTKKMTVQ